MSKFLPHIRYSKQCTVTQNLKPVPPVDARSNVSRYPTKITVVFRLYQIFLLTGVIFQFPAPPYPNINPLNAELNPICHLLILLGAHHILHISRIRVKRRIKFHVPFLALLGAHHILHISRIRVKRRIKSHLPSAGIIRSSPYSPR